MDFVSCTVRLAGNVQHTVSKRAVSVPEVLVLQAIHGEDAVVDMAFASERDLSSTEELARLEGAYKPELVRKLFPGAKPELPADASAIGVSKPKGPGAAKARAKPKPAVKGAGDKAEQAAASDALESFND